MVRIIYFSGTGGTKKIAEAFEKELNDREISVTVKNLGASIQEKTGASAEFETGEAELSLLIYPVYAMDAPKPVYDWIESLDSMESAGKFAIISVSGGGEMWPNKGCRNSCCKELERRGIQVVYDRMMCMPANVLVEYNDHLIMHLINAISVKVPQIIDELLAGKIRRTNFRKGFILNRISRIERENAAKLAQKFQITGSCTGCGWCVRNCPTSNIEISEGDSKPHFADRCVICTRCVYGCPTRAIRLKGSFTLKNGFDLAAVESRMEGVELQPVEKCCKGWIYMGVKGYLQNKY